MKINQETINILNKNNYSLRQQIPRISMQFYDFELNYQQYL